MLFTVQQANTLYRDVRENEANKKIIESLNNSLSIASKNSEIDAQKINILDKRNDELAQRLRDSQSMNDWQKVMYISLGVIATVGAGFAISRIK